MSASQTSRKLLSVIIVYFYDFILSIHWAWSTMTILAEPTKISIVSAHELDAGLLSTWAGIQEGRKDLASPFYCPEFTQIVAASRNDVRVAVIETAKGVAGFFPFHVASLGRIRSIGEFLNDYHGVISDDDLVLPPSLLLQHCAASYFSFNHMPMTQKSFAPFVRKQINSLVLDIEGGLEGYRSRLLAQPGRSSSRLFGHVNMSRRRLERDVGPVRFELNASNPLVYDQLLKLKADQFLRTGAARSDPFDTPWIKATLNRIRERNEKNFSGELSALYAGDKLIAAHFGMRSKDALHNWFITYDPAYSYYSPGTILMMSIVEEAHKVGIASFDMGRGHQAYKQRFATSAIPLGEGAVSRPACVARAFMYKDHCVDSLKASKVGDLWRARKRLFRSG